MAIAKLSHAVLYVRELDRSVAFYESVLGMTTVDTHPGIMAFLRAKDSPNHHDLGLFAVGKSAHNPPRGSVGLYHLAWEVAEIAELGTIRTALEALGAYVGASDHVTTKSVYGVDPDGLEFEVCWAVPREHWSDDADHRTTTTRLDLDAEIARWTPAISA
jgi:catechol-2,3-dioxygenase